VSAKPLPKIGYQSQLSRALRYLLRLRRRRAFSRKGVVEEIITHDDDLISFFMHCWHVKDWVQNDAAVPDETRKLVVADAHASEPLRVCADIANGSKHLQLDRPKVGGKGAALTDIEVTVARHGYEVSWEHRITIENGGASLTGYEAGRAALMEWKRILQSRGLLLPKDWVDP